MSNKDLKVVTWLWNGKRGYRAWHADLLAKMFKKYLTIPHEFICVNSMRGQKFDKRYVTELVMPDAAKELGRYPSPEGERFPDCYRRLWMFSDEAAEYFGNSRIMLIDLDAVLVGNIDHLITDYTAPFVGWRPLSAFERGGIRNRIGGGLYLMDSGVHREVYYDFTGYGSMVEAREAGYRGSDQAWLSYKLFDKIEIFDDNIGIYRTNDFRDERHKSFPKDACLIHFNGGYKPWARENRGHWVDFHLRAIQKEFSE